MDELTLKAAAAAIEAVTGRRPGTLDELLRAKAESDRRNYRAKHDIMRQLILKYPEAFMIDSEEGGVVGITHLPSRFRMHLPRNVVPLQLPRALAAAA